MAAFELIIQTLQIAIPAYIANGSPPFLIKMKKHPIDFGMSFKGSRIFGDGKTFEGFALACITGFLSGLLFDWLLRSLNLGVQLLDIPMIGFLLIGAGAMLGDLCGAFIKRRLKMPRGANAGLLDMEDFIIGSFLLAAAVVAYPVDCFIIALVVTPVVHRLANVIGYKIGVKKEPW
jgi:CDP-2,3-bis-(O-geranylgeranyl)-sn-glycerol synthase